MKPISIIFFFTYCLLSYSCQQVDYQLEKQKIQSLMDGVRDAHFEQNADKFHAPNDSVWLDIRNGNVQINRKETAITPTQNYLNDMEFLELKNSIEPVIEISQDGSMASYVGAIHLKGKFNNQPIFWVVAWQSILKKINGEWKIIQTANTELAESEMAPIILKNAKSAIGNEEKINEINNIYSLADCSFEGDKFKTLIFSSKSHARFEQKNDRGSNILATHENGSFQANPQTGNVKNNLDSQTQQFIFGHELHWLSLFPEQRYHHPVFKKYTKIDDKDAFQIEFTDDLNRPVIFYYDFENNLPIAIKIFTGTVEAGETVSVYFKDWKDQNGIQVFQNAVFQQGDFIFNYDFEAVKFNTLINADFEDQTKRIEN